MISVGMTISPYDKRRLIEWLRAVFTRATGRRYRIRLEARDDENFRKRQPLLSDLDQEKQMAVQRARFQPCRMWESS